MGELLKTLLSDDAIDAQANMNVFFGKWESFCNVCWVCLPLFVYVSGCEERMHLVKPSFI